MKFNFNFLFLIVLFIFSCQSHKEDLTNSTWKNCGKNLGLSDVLIFDDKLNFVRNDTILFGTDSAIAIIDTINLHYGERRLYVKSISDNKIYRFCEQ